MGSGFVDKPPLRIGPRDSTTGVILAGGRGTRMQGRDKGLMRLRGRTLVELAIEALAPQVRALLISANRNLDDYGDLGHAVVRDQQQDFAGPLAGMASGMMHARTSYIVTAPCDCPLLPVDLVQRLYRALRNAGADIAVAHDGERLQPTFCLADCTLRTDLLAYLEGGGRKIDRWFERHPWTPVDFSDDAAAFFNVNTPADLESLEHARGS